MLPSLGRRATAGPGRAAVHPGGHVRAATGDRDRFGLLINQLGGDPQGALLCVDLLLTHEGAAGRFLHTRGAWLRDDERHLIGTWTAIPIGAFEIREVRRDTGVTVRMLPGGEQVVRLALPVLVTRHRRRDLLDLLASGPSAEQLAAFVGPQPEPYLRNSDGHDYTDAEAVLQVAGDTERSWQRSSARLVRIDPRALEHHGERDGKTSTTPTSPRVARWRSGK